MTRNAYDLIDDRRSPLNSGGASSSDRGHLPDYGPGDLATHGLPPELAFLPAQGFSPEPLLRAVGSAGVETLEELLSVGRIREEVYYRHWRDI